MILIWGGVVVDSRISASRMSVPRVAPLTPAAAQTPVTVLGRIRRICECGRPGDDRHMRDKVFVCARCKFLDGSGWNDGHVVSMLREVRAMPLAEIVERLKIDVRSVQRVLDRMIKRRRLERYLAEVDVQRGEQGTGSRWMYRLCG